MPNYLGIIFKTHHHGGFKHKAYKISKTYFIPKKKTSQWNQENKDSLNLKILSQDDSISSKVHENTVTQFPVFPLLPYTTVLKTAEASESLLKTLL